MTKVSELSEGQHITIRFPTAAPATGLVETVKPSTRLDGHTVLVLIQEQRNLIATFRDDFEVEVLA